MAKIEDTSPSWRDRDTAISDDCMLVEHKKGRKKRLKFDCSAITEQNTRTIYMPDEDVYLSNGGGGGTTVHSDLTPPSLVWADSGHTGPAYALARFDENGNAAAAVGFNHNELSPQSLIWDDSAHGPASGVVGDSVATFVGGSPVTAPINDLAGRINHQDLGGQMDWPTSGHTGGPHTLAGFLGISPINVAVGSGLTYSGGVLSAAGARTATSSTSDLSKALQTTLAPDLDLTLAIPAAGNYAFQINFTASCSSTLPDLKVTVDGSVSITSMKWRSYGGSISGSRGAGDPEVIDVPAGVESFQYIAGILTTNGSGSFSLWWAQNVSNAAAMTLLAGATIELRPC